MTERAKGQLARAGFDPVYGARPLKRAIQKEVENPLALRLIEGGFREGETIVVDADADGHLVFEHAGQAGQANPGAEREAVPA